MRQRRGQVTLEYFILLSVMAAATLLGFTAVDEQMRNGLLEMFRSAHQAIASR